MNADGNTISSYKYDEFGNLLEGDAAQTPMLYTGQQYDLEIALLYLRSRYYEPNKGRFISKDRFKGYQQKPVTFNHYLYVGNNPLNFYDPSGFDEVSDIFGAGYNGPVNYAVHSATDISNLKQIGKSFIKSAPMTGMKEGLSHMAKYAGSGISSAGLTVLGTAFSTVVNVGYVGVTFIPTWSCIKANIETWSNLNKNYNIQWGNSDESPLCLSDDNQGGPDQSNPVRGSIMAKSEFLRRQLELELGIRYRNLPPRRPIK